MLTYQRKLPVSGAYLNAATMDLKRFEKHLLRNQNQLTLTNQNNNDHFSISFFLCGDGSVPASLSVSFARKFFHEPDTVRAVIELAIDHWGGQEASVSYTLRNAQDDDFDWCFWIRWLKAGHTSHAVNIEPFGVPSSAEEWLGGTLYTWPEHAPWLALDEYERWRRENPDRR